MVLTLITVLLNMIHFKNHCTYMLTKSEIEHSKRYYMFVISITV